MGYPWSEMENFEFHNPTRILFGRDTIPQIGEEIRRHGHHLVLLIAGGGSIRTNGVHETVTSSLRKAGVRWIECWGVRPNPVLSKVNEMADAANRAGVDALLAVGGGSVLDSAKAVAAGYYARGDLWRFFEKREPVMRALPLYTILTMSAAGSEMNEFAVITKEDERKKWPLHGPALFPKLSIIDPSVQASLPWSQTVNGVIDAMSHVQEVYFAGGDDETALAFGEGLLRSVLAAAGRLQSDPTDYPARASLAWAATLAVNGLAGAGIGDGDWATHGMEHGLSALYPDIAHGAGLGVIFPAWILYCHNANPTTFTRWAKNVWGQDNVEAGVAAFRARLKSWGAPTTLRELGVPEDRVDDIAANAFLGGMTGAVRRLDLDDYKRILHSAWA